MVFYLGLYTKAKCQKGGKDLKFNFLVRVGLGAMQGNTTLVRKRGKILPFFFSFCSKDTSSHIQRKAKQEQRNRKARAQTPKTKAESNRCPANN